MTPTTHMEWLAGLPLHVAAILILIPALGLTILGTVVIRAVFRTQISVASNVGPSQVQFMAEIYSVILGLVVFAAYNEYQSVRIVVNEEVAVLTSIVNISQTVPQEASDQVHEAVAAYAEAVAVDEWPAMSFGGSSQTVDDASRALFAAINDATPSDNSNVVGALTVADMRDSMRSAMVLRADRLASSPDENVSELLSWVVLLATALAVAISWFLRGPSLVIHLILGMILTTMYILFILLSVQLIYPFGGSLQISPEGFLAISGQGRGT